MAQQRSTSDVGTTVMVPPLRLSLTLRKLSLPEKQKIGFQVLTKKNGKKNPPSSGLQCSGLGFWGLGFNPLEKV